MLATYLSPQGFILFQRKLNSIILHKINKNSHANMSFLLSIYKRNNVIKDKAMIFDELFPELLDGTIVLNLFLHHFGNLPLDVAFEEIVSCWIISGKT